jgi:hypothetical protein
MSNRNSIEPPVVQIHVEVENPADSKGYPFTSVVVRTGQVDVTMSRDRIRSLVEFMEVPFSPQMKVAVAKLMKIDQGIPAFPLKTIHAHHLGKARSTHKSEVTWHLIKKFFLLFFLQFLGMAVAPLDIKVEVDRVVAVIAGELSPELPRCAMICIDGVYIKTSNSTALMTLDQQIRKLGKTVTPGRDRLLQSIYRSMVFEVTGFRVVVDVDPATCLSSIMAGSSSPNCMIDKADFTLAVASSIVKNTSNLPQARIGFQIPQLNIRLNPKMWKGFIEAVDSFVGSLSSKVRDPALSFIPSAWLPDISEAQFIKRSFASVYSVFGEWDKMPRPQLRTQPLQRLYGIGTVLNVELTIGVDRIIVNLADRFTVSANKCAIALEDRRFDMRMAMSLGSVKVSYPRGDSSGMLLQIVPPKAAMMEDGRDSDVCFTMSLTSSRNSAPVLSKNAFPKTVKDSLALFVGDVSARLDSMKFAQFLESVIETFAPKPGIPYLPSVIGYQLTDPFGGQATLAMYDSELPTRRYCNKIRLFLLVANFNFLLCVDDEDTGLKVKILP